MPSSSSSDPAAPVVLTPRPRPVAGDPAALDPSAAAARAAWPVALVAMPFQDHLRPSIQVGLLKAIAASHGFPAETLHLNLDLVGDLGVELYRPLFERDRARRVGDWLFAPAAFGDEAPDPDDRFLADLGDQLAFDDEQQRVLVEFRRHGVARYLDRLMAEIAWDRFRVVGFTSTFAQTVPSLALAARLKRDRPGTVVVFGGANLEGPMGVELVRTMDCIDFAVSGEGDVAFTELLCALSEGRDPAGTPGVLCRRDGRVVGGPGAAPFDRLDDLPTPDYREFFDRAARLGVVPEHGRHAVWLPAESARGCWWGQRRHCTFCGLNGSTIAYRAKSPERVRRELAELSHQSGSLTFGFVDNILDPGYVEALFGPIAAAGLDYRFFYEVKADLGREQIRALAEGGVRRFQPGIESLSSHVLGLMRKGVRASQNVNVLRWARHYGIHVSWNLIYGFPHETPEDYREQAELIPNLVHLDPPGANGRIWMERFSPLYTDRDAFPATWIAPERDLASIYPRRVDLEQIAYFFDYALEHTLPDEAFDEVVKAVVRWREADCRQVRPTLNVRRADDFIQIVDGRDPDVIGVHTFAGALATLYLGLMERPKSARMVAGDLGLPHPVEEVTAALDEFTARGLMLRDGNLFLSLALPEGPAR
ncbi:MAG TPA: RiPP maturation radical SAM C-methyltransferase [Acidimicrobiales bacterium]|nr:RiPP maturation radical SAM C-methyltransferase [Acidimicrobiales bacterium]